MSEHTELRDKICEFLRLHQVLMQAQIAKSAAIRDAENAEIHLNNFKLRELRYVVSERFPRKIFDIGGKAVIVTHVKIGEAPERIEITVEELL